MAEKLKKINPLKSVGISAPALLRFESDDPPLLAVDQQV